MRKRWLGALLLVGVISLAVCWVRTTNSQNNCSYGCQWLVKLTSSGQKSKMVIPSDRLNTNFLSQQKVNATEVVFTAEQELAIEKIITRYFRKNPKILLELEALLEQAKEQEQAEQLLRTEQKIPQCLNQLLDPKHLGSIKVRQEQDLVLVEFTQPLCAACKHSYSVIQKFLADKPQIQHILFYWPFLGGESIFWSKLILAAQWQNKATEVYDTIWQATLHDYQKEQVINRVKQIAGLDCKRLLKDQNHKLINEAIQRNFYLAKQLEFLGTPVVILVNRQNKKVQLIKNMSEQALKEGLDKVK